jgi:hypothetical protein
VSTDWRSRIRARHGRESASLLADLGPGPEDELQVLGDLRRYRLDAIREYDPAATLDEELRLRILGPEANGAVRFSWGSALMKPLEEGVSAASEQDIELELVGVSAGSTVMHVRPVAAARPTGALPTPVDATPADAAIRRLFALTDALEAEGDVRRYAGILEATDRLTEALDRFDLSVELRWYAARLRRTQDATTDIPISGRITELRASGIVKVKSGVSKTSPAWEVRMTPEDLLAMRLVIGQNVSFVVTQRRKLDSIGRAHGTVYDFVRTEAAHPFLEPPSD